MKKLHALAVFLALCVVSLGATALTLEPLPGSTPQTTQLYSYFPIAPGVIVRDGFGSPVAGVAVTFSWSPVYRGAYLIATGAGATGVSDAAGIAKPPEDLIAGGYAGSLTLTAATAQPGDTRATFELTVAPGGTRLVELVSGNAQYAQVGTYYAKPLVFRALDANGQPVPHAALWVLVAYATGLPTATMDGENSIDTRADASGNFVMPRLLAGPLAGQGYGYVYPIGNIDVPATHFYFENVSFPVAANAQLVSAPPQSVEVGHTTLQPWVVRVTGFSGEPLAGVPVAFVTVAECGHFGGATRVTLVSDANGLVSSPLFTGTSAVICNVWTETGGISLDRSLDLTVQVFNPELVVITPSDRYIETKPGATFRVDIAFTEWGWPIYGPPFQVEVVAPFHASATFVRQHAPYDSNVATLDFVANGKQGYYAIIITRGPVRTWITVDQRKH